MKRKAIYLGFALFLLPLVLAGVYILVVRSQSLFRYNKAYFTLEYQERYSTPGSVALAIESAVRSGDRSLFAGLTGLRHAIRPPEPNPDERLMILLKVTDSGYFQYLFFDVKTYRRATYHVKRVDGRWAMVPDDAYYFLDSGDWLLFFTPVLLLWWGLLAVAAIGMGIFRAAAVFRQQLYGQK